MRKILYVAIITASLFLSCAVYAEDISISAELDKREISLGEQLTLIVTVRGNVSNIPQPQVPALNAFTAYSAGRSQNISIINGQVSSSVSFTYILVPNDAGDYTLGPFTIEYKGKTYSTDSIDVLVTAQASATQSPSQQPYSGGQSGSSKNAPQETKGKDLFIETFVDKKKAYVNEQITLTFAFYQSVNLFENPRYNPPSTTGFWAEDMPPQNKYYKIIDGRQYLVTEIKTALFATSPGQFTIGEARLETAVEDFERIHSRSPFDIFDDDPFGMFRKGKPLILTTEPLIIDILPLPDEGKPSNFRGDVGRFNISASIDKDSVEENQPVTLKVKIAGQGNIKTISPPDIADMEGVKFYDSASSENVSKSDYVVQGEKAFEKVIIPKRPGDFQIGPIEYSYFDPVEKKYFEKKIEPMRITAIKSKEEIIAEASFSAPGLTKEEIEILKRDICYIKTAPMRARPKDEFLYKNKIFLSINIFPLVLLMLFYAYEKHRERLRTDIGYARSRRAKALSQKRLKTAKNIMHKGNIKEFYAEIYRIVTEYIADRLNIPSASITRSFLEPRLAKKNVRAEIIDRLGALCDICDMARFASAGFTKIDMSKALKEAADIITELEKVK